MMAMAFLGMPRSNNGPEFIAKALGKRLKDTGVGIQHIESDNFWENGFVKSMNGMLRRTLEPGSVYQFAGSQCLTDRLEGVGCRNSSA